MRLDAFLSEKGLSKSRTAAEKLIKEGGVSLDGRIIQKPSFPIDPETELARITLKEGCPYVSRGGYKLEAALRAFHLSPEGAVALDIGASSGGFTDCLLQHGALRVYAVDVGQGQLAPSLREDPRVILREGFNARYMTEADFPERPTFVTMDVSFISQALILPAIYALLPEGGILVSLIKPQFEVGRAGLGKGGIVRDDRTRREAQNRVLLQAQELGFSILGVTDSPIEGGDGNKEYLAALERRIK